MIYLGNSPVGVAVEGNSMKIVQIYTVQESWENDTKGNAQAIYDLLMKEYVEQSSDYNLVVAVFENNSSASYNANYISAYGNSSGMTVGESVRNNNSSSNISVSRSMWASVGTVIKVYSLNGRG